MPATKTKKTPEQIEAWKQKMATGKLAKKLQAQQKIVEEKYIDPEIVMSDISKFKFVEKEDTGSILAKGLIQTEPTREPIKQNHMSAAVFEQETRIQKPTLGDIRGRISIKPYVSGEENMGLEKTNEVLFPGIRQEDRLGCKAENGYITYFTGLDENAPEVQKLQDTQRLAKIKSIREVVAYLENSIGNNFEVRVDNCMENFGTKNDEFWKNVNIFKSSGPDKFDQKGIRVPTYWDSVKLELTNDDKQLDKSNAHDLVIYYAIQAGGLSMVAPSLQKAIDSQGAYKWYLDQPEETADIRTEQKVLRNQAGGHLEAMRINNEGRLFLMCKTLAVQNSAWYRRGGPNYTPVKAQYEDLSEYIDGRKGDNATIAVGKFLETYDMPIDILTRKAVLKDATELHLIEFKGDGRLYYKNECIGKTLEDAIEYLNNPMNESAWVSLRNKVEEEWTA